MQSSRTCFGVTVATALTLVLGSVPLARAGPGPSGRIGQGDDQIEGPPDGSSDAFDPRARPKLCAIAPTDGMARLDLLQLRVYQTVCSTAAWFDKFFGDLRAEEDNRQGARGRLGVGLNWDQADTVDVDTTFRVHFPLPRAERRLRAFLGKVESEQFIDDVSGGFETIPLVFRELEDEEWLVGLGYRRPSRERTSLDVSVGVNFRTPIEPYVNTRYRIYFRLGEQSLGRFRETIFWRKRKGYGATSRLDLERLVGDRILLRWVNAGTVSEADRGLSWYSQATVYRHVGKGRALAFQTGLYGETDARVPVRDYVVRTIYRQSVRREWLFGEARLGIHWPRRNEDLERKPAVVLGVGMEMRFDKSFVELGRQR